MVPAEEPERAAVLHLIAARVVAPPRPRGARPRRARAGRRLVAEEEQRALEPVRATVNVVAEEEVVGLRREAAVLEEPQQVVVLPVDVAADLDRRLELEQDRLAHEHLARAHAQHADLVVLERDLLAGALAPHREQLLQHGVDGVRRGRHRRHRLHRERRRGVTNDDLEARPPRAAAPRAGRRPGTRRPGPGDRRGRARGRGSTGPPRGPSAGLSDTAKTDKSRRRPNRPS
mmetsp:Transcript_22516/g.74662  ORF Transcript_22516/g.74662 Transcript_22516/m.74662 type:complete len:231 (+) Transcript_22516:653-1345(+)